MKVFETPEIKEIMKKFETPDIKLLDLNRADEYIKVSVCRYQELLDAETRLDAIVDYLKGKLGKYTSVEEKDVLIIAGYASYVNEFYKEQED